MSKRILVLNLGSTSTKIAIFENTIPIIKESILHEVETIKQFKHTMDQKNFRKNIILNYLAHKSINIENFDCIIARGGNCKPLSSGIYKITEEMLDDIKSERTGVHPVSYRRRDGKVILIKYLEKGSDRHSTVPAEDCV
ncbi:hypothetical protein HZF24_17040 [Sedimentibacter hydroxybenzoicus DSM 7310]|uniref:butyrate kinase n=1 Tax=Sedimentibacter hydroxybenzoicus DSM 7310 TaxID=1123245 RepID=A0A974BN69_SEDHY|nr:hypothetical protein [Sedimentibacter hydroxybenzoicus]NYB75857.1 hypothetical protein [Sedimentibacter hydroxybenzoicus DSM 7310]